MDFRFDEQQLMMAHTVRGMLADTCTSADLRALGSGHPSYDAKRWKTLSAMGLWGIMAPESVGGLDLSELDFVLIAEAAGYALLPEPLIDSAGIAIPLLAALRENDFVNSWLTRAVTGEVYIGLQHPENAVVQQGEAAAALMLAGSEGLYLLTREAAKIQAAQSIDPLAFAAVSRANPRNGTKIASCKASRELLALAHDRGALFAAAQGLGIAQKCIELAVAYAKERIQFTKPIGSFQAVKHLLATAQVKLEFARPVVYAAAGQFSEQSLHSRARISHAKLAALSAAEQAARAAIQVHGAMGYTWEVDVHFYLKRALALGMLWGDTGFHRRRIIKRLQKAPIGADCTFLRQSA